jgi:hypothetical protein
VRRNPAGEIAKSNAKAPLRIPFRSLRFPGPLMADAPGDGTIQRSDCSKLRRGGVIYVSWPFNNLILSVND